MMNKLINNIAIPSLLAAGMAMSPIAQAQSPFDGKDVNVKFEMWKVDANNMITDVLAVRHEQDVMVSDMSSPDLTDFFAMDEQFHLWDITFKKQEIELVFTSIEVQDIDNQYMYMSPVGFHISDTTDNLSDILHVDVIDTFAPSFFNKNLSSFDANNIYVSLQGSMCHIAGMGSMPECVNSDSLTGYNNSIKVNVLFADTADALYDWLETEYPEYFPTHQVSSDVAGYYARYYPGIDIYLGTLNGKLYAYGSAFGGLLDAGDMAMWIDKIPMQDGECPEGQHMMPGGMCMSNMAM